MSLTHSAHIRAFSLALFVVFLYACGAAPTSEPVQKKDKVRAVNLAGSWEMDYGQSDNAQQELDRLVRELQREIERRRNGAIQQGPVGAGLLINGNGLNSGDSIMGLVRFTDMITQASLLEIEQDDHSIRVRREDDADLTCTFVDGAMHVVETPFGEEICGWKGHQLVFRLALPGGLRIEHVLTAGRDRQKLNVATTVATGQVSRPFTLNRVYNRFVPGERGFRCEMTLTRGRVCTTRPR